MKAFASALLVTILASAEVFSLSKGNCNPHSLLDETQCSNLAAQMGVKFYGSTVREGFFFPRGCYLYNTAEDPTRSGRTIGFYFNMKPKQGPCTKVRTCYCDNHPKRTKEPKEFTNDLVMLNKGKCDKGTGLNRQECEALSLVSGFDKALGTTWRALGTTCKAADCAPPGCHLFNGRELKVVNHASTFNIIRFFFNDYKTGKCTDDHLCVCHRRNSGSKNYGGHNYDSHNHGSHNHGGQNYGDHKKEVNYGGASYDDYKQSHGSGGVY